ncbi:hypothetical protein FRC01_001636 [Tulasnella sp. 417]|nr:hypothetical protein FRC01_001636 [Tulasnella sp. 417]
MAPTTANVGAGSIAVAVRPVRATSHILTPSFPSRKFATSPANHGLPRTGLKLTNGDTVFSAIMDGMAYRLQHISLSEQSAGQPTAQSGGSVHIGTCTPPGAFTVNQSVRRKLASYNSKLFARCTQSIRDSFKRAALKRDKKTGGASRPPPSQCPLEADPLVMQGVESIWVGSVLAALEANQHQATQFDEMSSLEVQAPVTPAFPPPTYLGGPLPNAPPAMATPGDETTDKPMDEDVEDIDMKAQDNCPSQSVPMPIPFVQSTEPSSALNVDESSERYTSQSSAPTPASAAPIGVEPHDGAFAQPLWTSRPDTAPESRQPTQVAHPQDVHANQRQFALPQSHGFVLTSTETSTSFHSPPAVTPSSTPTNSTAGPSTPTESSHSSFTLGQGQPTQTHATRLHQALGKWGPPKRASKVSQPSVGDGDSEEAEAAALVAKYKAVAHPPVQTTSTPGPLPSPSEPKRTKGSAARSLMDDIMAGFRGLTKPKSSQQQAPAVAQPPTQPNPAPTNLPRPSLVARHPRPVVAGRQTGPRFTQPHHIGIGPVVAAPGGSVIPSRSAPSTVPMSGEVNEPSGRNIVRAGPPSEAVPPMPAHEPSNVAMDDVQVGGRIVKGSKRVARVAAATGSTWQTIQQKARETQAALDLEHSIAAATPTSTSSLKAFEEYVRSSAWHRAQPPPPPEAIPYIGIGGKPCRGAPEGSSRSG